MKIHFGLVLSAVLISGSVHAASASLQYPLVFEKKKGKSDYAYVLLSTLNAKLKAKGMKTFPDKAKLTSTAQAGKTLDAYSAYADKAAKELGLENVEMTRYSMSAVSGLGAKDTLCYTGSPAEAVDLINSLSDVGFSDQQGMIGWRYKKEKHLIDDMSDSDFAAPKIWKEWRGQGEAILFLWHEGDDGDDVNEAIIPRCL